MAVRRPPREPHWLSFQYFCRCAIVKEAHATGMLDRNFPRSTRGLSTLLGNALLDPWHRVRLRDALANSVVFACICTE